MNNLPSYWYNLQLGPEQGVCLDLASITAFNDNIAFGLKKRNTITITTEKIDHDLNFADHVYFNNARFVMLTRTIPGQEIGKGTNRDKWRVKDAG